MKKILIFCFLCSSVFTTVMATEQKKPQAENKNTKSQALQAQDHNSTRSNRGTVVAPKDTNSTAENLTASQLQSTRTGRNPQTGKGIQTSKKRKGRNPQTGKEIDIADKND